MNIISISKVVKYYLKYYQKPNQKRNIVVDYFNKRRMNVPSTIVFNCYTLIIIFTLFVKMSNTIKSVDKNTHSSQV